MNFDILKITLSQMLVMFFFVIMGYFFGKKKLSKSIANGLSFIQINLFMPLMVLNSVSTNLTRTNAVEKGSFFLISVPLVACVIVAAKIISRLITKERMRKNMLIYSLAFTNFGYLGYPVIRYVFGEEMLSNFIIFAMPFTLLLYSYGQSLFDKSEKMPFRKKLVRPVTVALVVGAFLGLCEIPLPKAVTTVFSMGADCVGPNAMLMTGIVISSCKLSEIFKRKSSYIISFIKLVVMPVLFTGILYLLGIRGVPLLCAATITALPTGMNVIVFSEANGLDSTEAAGHCLIASLFSIITIPLLFAVITAIM